MNWDAIGAIGEIIGAIAVVVSVLYLAFQIRHNTQASQGATIQGITDTIQRENRWSSDLGEVFLKAIESSDTLSKVEAFQVGEWLTAAMSARQNEFLQYRRGLIDQEMWDASRGIIRTIMSIDFCRDWWLGWDHAVYNPEFVAIVNEIVGSAQDWRFDKHLDSLSARSQVVAED